LCTFSPKAKGWGLSYNRPHFGNGTQLYCGQPPRGIVECHHYHGGLLVRTCALLLLSWSHQRIRGARALPGTVLRAASAARSGHGRALKIRASACLCCGHPVSCTQHERAVPEGDWPAFAAEPAGSGHIPAVLGMDLGRLWTDSRNSLNGEHQNRLRLYRTAPTFGRLARRLIRRLRVKLL